MNLGSISKTVLLRARDDPTVIQDFCPLPQSVEWQLGQRYWHERGSQAFLSDARPVPYVVNNDGTLSRHAGEVLFSCFDSPEQSNALPKELFTLELGVGTGLFARYVLDGFRDLCDRHGKDYYDHLTYIAADRSEAMVRDACRHGLFADHPGRYLLRVVDALQPDRGLRQDPVLAPHFPRPFRAVFLNYLLACLPAAVLEVDGDQVHQLCVRTGLARGADLSEVTDLTADQLAQRAGSSNPDDLRDLLRAYPLFAAEYAYRPVEVGQIPYGDFAVRFARANGGRVVHNYGAIQCLERLLELIPADGFILFNDYGQTQVSAADHYEHQHFSLSVAIGLNLPLLKAYFEETGKARWVEPTEGQEALHSRLLSRKPAEETVRTFQECFHKAAFERLHQPAQQAREWAKVGRFEAAAVCYRQALQRQPYNWVLLDEFARFLTYPLRDLKAAIDLARLGLAQNPISSELWCTLGDALYEFGRTAEARDAYERALRFKPSDIRARLNLAFVHLRDKDHAAALSRIAEGLALDRTGEYRERLLRKQAEVLDALAQRYQREAQRLIDRIIPAADRPVGSPSAAPPVRGGAEGLSPSSPPLAPATVPADPRTTPGPQPPTPGH